MVKKNQVPKKKCLVDVYFTVEYSKLVEVTAPGGATAKQVHKLAKEKCREEILPHVETVFEAHSGCYLDESFKTKRAEIQDVEFI